MTIITTPSESSPNAASLQQTYPGGKGNSYQQIINQMPPHTAYIEPFLGHGAVMRAKQPAELNIGIDRDWNALRYVEETIRASSPQPAMNAGTAPNGVTGIPTLMTMTANLAIDSDTSVWLLQGNALLFLKKAHLTGDEFIYADPPYLFSTRASNRHLYAYEFGEASHHERLLTILRGLDCPVAISGYSSELYNDILYDWRVHTFTAVTRGGTVATEWLWMNYPKPRKLHEYTYLGDNFRERERIKRKATRWVNRFASLPALERAAIIDQLQGAGIAVNGGRRGNV